MGRWIAEKLNRCNGEVRFIIPTAGFSALDVDGAHLGSYRRSSLH